MVDEAYLCKESFESFCHLMDPNFLAPWHVCEIIKHLEAVERGEIKRLIIELPPRHGKTHTSSLLFPAWFFAKHPEKNVMLISYNQDLANDFGRQIRAMMSEPLYQQLFNVRIPRDSNSKKRFSTNHKGGFFGLGRGGAATGRGGDIIIVDDLVKNEQEARSAIFQKNNTDWFDGTIYSRRQNKEAAFIIVNTRWNEKDLIGYLTKKKNHGWTRLKIPAISKEGKALWPEKFDLDYLLDIKENKFRVFQTQYQQEPFPEEGNIIKEHWIKRFSVEPVVHNKLLSLDLSFKGGKSSDFVVGGILSKNKGNIYLLDMIRGQYDFVETMFHVKQLLKKHPDCYSIVIEDAANGAALYSMIKKHFSGVKLWKPQTDKSSRLYAVSPIMEAENFWMPEDSRFDVVKNELVAFPFGDNDDCVDMVTQGIINLQKYSSKSSIVVDEGQY